MERVRIDIAYSVLKNVNNELEKGMEEIKLKRETGMFLYEKGYEKFVVADGDLISDDIKEKLQQYIESKKEIALSDWCKTEALLFQMQSFLESESKTLSENKKEEYIQKAKEIEELLNQIKS